MVQVLGSQIGTRIKRQFGDESGVQVTDADVMMWLNDAIREAVIQNSSINIKRKFVPALVGQNLNKLPDPENLVGVRTISYRHDASSAYIPLEYLSPVQFDTLIPDWNFSGNTGHPCFYTSDSTSKFRVYPAPQVNDGLGFTVEYNSFFCEVDDLTIPMEISGRYYQYLVEYCLMKAYEMDENWEAADRKASFIQSTLNVLASEDGNQHQQTYPVISTLPEDM